MLTCFELVLEDARNEGNADKDIDDVEDD